MSRYHGYPARSQQELGVVLGPRQNGPVQPVHPQKQAVHDQSAETDRPRAPGQHQHPRLGVHDQVLHPALGSPGRRPPHGGHPRGSDPGRRPPLRPQHDADHQDHQQVAHALPGDPGVPHGPFLRAARRPAPAPRSRRVAAVRVQQGRRVRRGAGTKWYLGQVEVRHEQLLRSAGHR